MSKRKPWKGDVFDWFERYTKSKKTWGELKHDCGFAVMELIKPQLPTYIDDFQNELPFVAWLFQNHNCSSFALILQADLRPGMIEYSIYSLRSYACMTNECGLRLYVTGVIFNDDLLMLEFKLRFGDLIIVN